MAGHVSNLEGSVWSPVVSVHQTGGHFYSFQRKKVDHMAESDRTRGGLIEASRERA